MTDNEAGSAVALLLGGVLALVAIQGTRVQRISAGENSLDFAERVRANVARQAEDAAQESPELAEALIESYQSADPLAQSDPSIIAAKASIYERQAVNTVMEAMQGLAPNATLLPGVSDLAYRIGDALLVVEVKHRKAHRKLYLDDVRQISRWMDAMKASSGLLISNVTPTSQAAKFIEESRHPINIVLWQPDFGPERILKALSEIVRISQ